MHRSIAGHNAYNLFILIINYKKAFYNESVAKNMTHGNIMWLNLPVFVNKNEQQKLLIRPGH